MNQAPRIDGPGIWPAIQQVAHILFKDGSDHIRRELPLGELALSRLDIEQRAQQFASSVRRDLM
jgi:hypothetical protein